MVFKSSDKLLIEKRPLASVTPLLLTALIVTKAPVSGAPSSSTTTPLN